MGEDSPSPAFVALLPLPLLSILEELIVLWSALKLVLLAGHALVPLHLTTVPRHRTPQQVNPSGVVADINMLRFALCMQ